MSNKKKIIPSLGELASQRKGSTVEQLLGDDAPSRNAASPTPQTKTIIQREIVFVTPEDHYMLCDADAVTKTTVMMNNKVYDKMDRLESDFRSEYRRTGISPPKKTDIYHLAFKLLFEHVEEGGEAWEASKQWMTDRREKQKELQYANRGGSPGGRPKKEKLDHPDGVREN